MEPTHGPLDQLDVPLVWDRKPQDAAASRIETGPPRQPTARWSRVRLWTAALADLGVVLLAVSAVLAVAASLGASLQPFQLAVATAAGVLVAGALGVGTVWGWRGTPGMALLHLRFHAPVALRRAHRVWLVWLLALLALGLPLLPGRRGRTLAERAAGAEITLD